MDVLVTGSKGFIGKALCKRLNSEHNIIGVDCNISSDSKIHGFRQIDLTNLEAVGKFCKNYPVDVIIHCAGIAHQKFGTIDQKTYMKVNSVATENLAKAVANCNPDAVFFFLSSISVYGENDLRIPVSEKSRCIPTNDYAKSKLNAENRLIDLWNCGIIKKLYILRLAPVYDSEWGFNLERRVLAPKKVTYIKFGSGRQKMSALARPNIVEFIQFLLNRPPKNGEIKIMNVCDAQPYEFNKIIQVFNNSGLYPIRPTITMPLPIVWVTIRIAGLLLTHKRKWLHSCYEKLASSLVFDNSKMLETGFKPRHSLHTIFDPQITQINPPRAD